MLVGCGSEGATGRAEEHAGVGSWSRCGVRAAFDTVVRSFDGGGLLGRCTDAAEVPTLTKRFLVHGLQA
eukprot:5006981-Prymnesium_polylepis.1